MCIGGPKAPAAPPKLPEAPTAPTAGRADTGAAERRRRAAAGGGTGTVLTGARGLADGATATAGKTLLGQ